jgi:hypothetical protein
MGVLLHAALARANGQEPGPLKLQHQGALDEAGWAALLSKELERGRVSSARGRR